MSTNVTNLTNSGPGSIVDAVSAGNRTIVFRVSGTIELGDVILEPKSNTHHRPGQTKLRATGILLQRPVFHDQSQTASLKHR